MNKLFSLFLVLLLTSCMGTPADDIRAEPLEEQTQQGLIAPSTSSSGYIMGGSGADLQEEQHLIDVQFN